MCTPSFAVESVLRLAGADLDLKQCHPWDLDPHAVSSIFKSYLRECEWLNQTSY